MNRCGAKTRDGDPCKNAPVHGRDRCRMHGGKQPLGIARPGTTHGRFSKHLPTRLLATYEESRTDPDLLNLTDAVALADSKIVEMLGKVDTGESGAAWKTAYDALHAFKRANLRKDADAAREALQDLERVISRGHASSAAWDELSRWIEQRRKLSESETKRRVAGRDLVHADQAMLFVIALTGAVREHVHDPAILAAISADLARIAPNVADGNRSADAA